MALKQELMQEYAEYLPDLPRDEARRIRGEQEIIVRYEPEKALATLPKLLSDPADRARLVEFLRKLFADPRIRPVKPTARQLEILETLPRLLANRADRERFLTVVSKLISDERVLALKPTEQQIEMLGRIRGVLGLGGSPKLAAVG